MYGASWAHMKGKSPMPVQASLHSLIMAPNTHAYSDVELWVTTLCSP
eukprot:COSAG01_NODE_1485_length_10131_cov_10.500995_3_plen_47_part_00